ncbi:hypothetical protein D7Z54_09135 [Salibacterium salarium]|uniref:Uncharacterized protein n=1 Tax=Salibacterium salarium TaxID=284579 RepID=A0A3R9Q547_9BACI|nr:hypothetical protein [Salibacterium salarium]RSL33843.1 hypothetical protein D7Z54_09135 [Salibacterium salarium]
MNKLKVLFRDAEGNIVEEYVLPEEKIDIDKEKKLQRELEFFKTNKTRTPDRGEEANEEEKHKTRMKQLQKKLNNIKESNKSIKEKYIERQNTKRTI